MPFLALCFYLVCFSALFPLPFYTLCLPPSGTSHFKHNKRNTVSNVHRTIHVVFLTTSLSLSQPSSPPLIVSYNFIRHNLNHIKDAFYLLQTDKKKARKEHYCHLFGHPLQTIVKNVLASSVMVFVEFYKILI